MSSPPIAEKERARILVVDDDPAARLSLQAILEELYEVAVAASVDEAERILAEQHILVLVTDYEMPERSGMDLIFLVLEKYPLIVPILFTGYVAKREVRLAYKDRNVFAVLDKPADPAGLLRTLRLAVATARLRNLQRKTLAQKGSPV